VNPRCQDSPPTEPKAGASTAKVAASEAHLPRQGIAEPGDLNLHLAAERENFQRRSRQGTEDRTPARVLSSRMRGRFDAIITGASPKGTWVRLFQPPVESGLDLGFQGLDVGDCVHVKLVHTEVEHGFIDFVRD
jgi:hypothetical protein